MSGKNSLSDHLCHPSMAASRYCERLNGDAVGDATAGDARPGRGRHELVRQHAGAAPVAAAGVSVAPLHLLLGAAHLVRELARGRQRRGEP